MIKIKKKIIISIMGVDGSGKTTLAKKINKIFKKSKYLHLKPYILFKDRRTVIKNPHSKAKSTSVVSLLRLFSWLASYTFFFYQKKNIKIYIFDRYAHDILIDPLRYRHNISRNLTKYILDLFPKPNLWIFLNPTLKSIKSRKNELTKSELIRQTKSYISFFKNKRNVLIFKNNKFKKNVISEISNKINNLIK